MKTILRKMLRHGLRLILLAVVLLPTVSRAQTSQYMSYQGYLTDANGNALGSTNTGPKAYDVVFRIWDAATGGNEYFSELQTVTVDNGYFSVLLGQGTPYSLEPALHVPLANVFSNSAQLSRYVEMTVLGIGANGSITILPRLQLVSSPFAFQAANALNITGTNVINAANFSTNLGVWQAFGTNIYRTGGNVGIGTSSPGESLDIAGNGHISGPLLLKGEGDGNHGVGYATSTTNFAGLNPPDGPMLWGYAGGALGSMNLGAKLDLVWTQAGNVGIGTNNPGATLDVNGDMQLEGTHLIYNSANGVVDWGSGSLLFRTDAPAGNIGSYATVMTLASPGELNVYGNGAGYYFNDRDLGAGYQSWAWYATGGSAYLYSTALGANTMTFALGGSSGANIGIANNAPLLTMDFSGNSNIIGTSYAPGGEHSVANRGTKVSFGYDVAGGTEFSGMRCVVDPGLAGCGNSGDLQFWTWQCNTATAREVMRVNGTGYVGIQTTTPGYPLDVEANYNPLTYAQYEYMNFDGVGHWGGGAGTFPISIYASERIMCAEVDAFSDARIKNIVGVSSGAKDLETLKAIEVTDFTYKDVVAKGNRPVKKAIAQQVETVYPQAVNKGTNFIPDIYALAANVVQSDGTLLITMAKPHGLREGDKVKWLDDMGGVNKSEVTKVDSEIAFEVKHDGEVKKAFVYGREVNDFRSIDYDAIAMLNVSATQELAKKIEKLESSETHIAELEQKAAKVDTLEQEVAELKKTVAQLAEAAKNGKMAETPVQKTVEQPSFTATGFER